MARHAGCRARAAATRGEHKYGRCGNGIASPTLVHDEPFLDAQIALDLGRRRIVLLYFWSPDVLSATTVIVAFMPW